MHSTNYIIRFVLILTAIVAIVLSLMSTGLKPIHDKNEAVYNKSAILSAVSNEIGDKFATLTPDDVDAIFDKDVKQLIIDMEGNIVQAEQLNAMGYKDVSAESIDMEKEMKKAEKDRMLPLYEYTSSNGDAYYIVSVRGKGLWDAIWGNIALKSDLSTIAGVSFDHKAETPGLGAEIKDSKAFQEQFTGKQLYDEQGNFTSVGVIKGGAKDPKHEVDGISGATITADGVSEMLERGIAYYEPYFEKLKK